MYASSHTRLATPEGTASLCQALMPGRCIYNDFKLKKTLFLSPWSIHKFFSAVRVNPFKPEFTIDISIHYKPGIAVAILDL